MQHAYRPHGPPQGFGQDLVEDRTLVIQAASVNEPLLEGSSFGTVRGRRVQYRLQQIDVGNDRLVASASGHWDHPAGA